MDTPTCSAAETRPWFVPALFSACEQRIFGDIVYTPAEASCVDTAWCDDGSGRRMLRTRDVILSQMGYHTPFLEVANRLRPCLEEIVDHHFTTLFRGGFYICPTSLVRWGCPLRRVFCGRLVSPGMCQC